MSAFYNEWEPYPAAWIRNLVAAGHVADGTVDERSICDLRAAELAAVQCHFFAGLGGWSYALRLAGWPDDRPVWTASCPCQPFSAAGKRRGTDDDRHLWPVVFELVRECRPPILFGEQVASPDGRAWFDAVSDDLESAGYAVGAANLCAAGVGAPHLRQRLYFVAVADADGERLEGERLQLLERGPREASAQATGRGEAGERVADGQGIGRSFADDSRMGDADREPGGRDGRAVLGAEGSARWMRPVDHRPGTPNVDTVSAWSDAEWIRCTDGKSRPAQPGSFPLAYGIPARVGKLRAYGNAIVPQVAATFIRAVMA